MQNQLNSLTEALTLAADDLNGRERMSTHARNTARALKAASKAAQALGEALARVPLEAALLRHVEGELPGSLVDGLALIQQ